jgi:hypothetical protein
MSDDNQNDESDNNYYEICGYYLVPYKVEDLLKELNN